MVTAMMKPTTCNVALMVEIVATHAQARKNVKIVDAILEFLDKRKVIY